MFKKCRDSKKPIATLAKIQSTREASHHLTFMDNCQTFYLRLGVLLWVNSKAQGECITS